MEHQEIFPTHLFIKDDYIDLDRVNVMKDDVMNILYKNKPNWQSVFNLDKSIMYKALAKDIVISAFEIFNRLPKTEQNKILKHIEDNLSEFMRPRFKAEGVNNILIKRSNFIPHMVDYYIPELADFDKWNSK